MPRIRESMGTASGLWDSSTWKIGDCISVGIIIFLMITVYFETQTSLEATNQ